MIHTAELDIDQFGVETETDIPITLDVFSYFREHGYPVDNILEGHSIVHKKPDGEDTAHVVLKIETLSKPIDVADVAVDGLEVYACDCKAYQFHHSVDLKEKRIAKWDVCKHIEAVDPSLKAKNDATQTEL